MYIIKIYDKDLHLLIYEFIDNCSLDGNEIEAQVSSPTYEALSNKLNYKLVSISHDLLMLLNVQLNISFRMYGANYPT